MLVHHSFHDYIWEGNSCNTSEKILYKNKADDTLRRGTRLESLFSQRLICRAKAEREPSHAAGLF